MNSLNPIQISSFFAVIPSWLPPATISTGFILMLIGMSRRYLDGKIGHWDVYSPGFSTLSALAFSFSVAGAVYSTIHIHDLVLLFVFFVFISGRIVQGAVTSRFMQKILDFLLSLWVRPSDPYINNPIRYLAKCIKQRLTILVLTGLLTVHTAASIAAVYTIGTGNHVEALARFWIGLFYLTALGMVFDFRHFAHRISWTAAFGLIVAVSGAFFYSPVGFSSYTRIFSPYFSNPLPDWMRWPLGLIGFVAGVLLWAIFYAQERKTNPIRDEP